MKKLLLLGTLVAGLIAFALPAEATVILWDFNYEFSGASEPEGAPPWLTATFDDEDSAGSVLLTIAAANLTDAEHVKAWYFNIDPGFTDTLTFTTIAWTGAFTLPTISTGQDAFKADGDGLYDIKFAFDEGDRFGVGDSLTLQISGTSLLAGSINFLSTEDGGDSGWIAPSDGGMRNPEHATLLLLGSGLIGLFGFRKSLRK
ncbi:MAG: hypothetical protein JSW35_11280 [Deltaproteobacteria bacterium]|nr:MAG: hypothetical protein JSW35_11280 [Deltaproteobacteria bacterium]